jgi:hypothetical protein
MQMRLRFALKKNLNNCGSLVGDKPKLCFLCIFKVAPLKAPDYNVSDIKKTRIANRKMISSKVLGRLRIRLSG